VVAYWSADLQVRMASVGVTSGRAWVGGLPGLGFAVGGRLCGRRRDDAREAKDNRLEQCAQGDGDKQHGNDENRAPLRPPVGQECNCKIAQYPS
jgi:hypothetical protein